MLYYNIPSAADRQAPTLIAIPTRTGRWVTASCRQRHSARTVAAAVLLHAALIGWLLESRLAGPPLLPTDQASVDMVFAPAVSPHPPAVRVPPAAAPDAAVPPAPPAPPPVLPSPAASSPPPPARPDAAADVPVPSPPAATTIAVPPPVPAPPRLARKPPPRAPRPRPVARRPSPAAATSSPRAAASPAPRAATADQRPSSAAPAPPISTAWRQALFGWLSLHKTYPEEARRRGDQGRAVLRFTVDRSGKVLAVELVRGTGSSALDSAARDLLRGATLPPVPAGMSQDQVTVTVQLRYELED